MQTDERTAAQSASSLRYLPALARHRLPLREAALLLFYHLRLLNWWLFLLMFLGFLGAGGLLWLQLHIGSAQGASSARELSQFVMESGAGLIAGMLTSALIVGDPLLEVMMATYTGIRRIVVWRYVLTICLLLCCSAAYLAWSLHNGISYAQQQSPLFLLLVWLVPVLIMSMLGLFGTLATRNSVLGLVIASIPLGGALFLYSYLLPMQGTHPFLIPYTSWGADASDWWTNRLTLLGIALALTAWNWWWLRYEERLLDNGQ